MRVAKTISDVAELLADYQVELQLTDGPAIYVHFPDTEEEKKYAGTIRGNNFDNFSHLSDADPIKFTRKTRYAVRSLVESPRFWGLTTVADQLGNFSFTNTDFGKVKVRKRADEPLTMLFESYKLAKKFFYGMRKHGNWQQSHSQVK